MEQTVNTWSKGLQMDTNPMVQNNDTLTGALNATFITQNGNEVILQNDMGNRRVDNAVLPDGYEPVGMKEYGGIIYIAAYNPITNRSQIGSFPSPERRINEIDDDSLQANVNFNFSYYQEKNLNNITCLQQDLVLIPLTKDTSLHAGDKFILWTNDNLYSYDITNMNNIFGNQVESPKNKQYTLSVGILNSQNEFVDITNTLVRWDNDGNLINTDNLSDLMKFNTGYFIKYGEPEKTLSHDTDADSALKNERELSFQVMKANTYSYKLVGPLYLQVKYNHIQDFSYNIYGNYNGKDADLYIEGFITYNCPDGCSNDNINDSSNDYHSYYEGKVNENFGFDFIVFNEGYTDEGYKYSTDCIYDPSTNLYKVTLIKHIKLTNIKNTTIEYVLGVKANLNDQIYLAGLSTKGTLDLSKLGSGEISITGWRFINNYNTKSGTITYTLDAYPKYEDKFTNITFTFTNVENNKNQIRIEAPVNNGKTNLNVEWNPNKENSYFWERALYRVSISYNTEQGNTIIIKHDDQNYHNEFYLTTELFNSCYSSKSTNSDFVVDYGWPINISNDGTKTSIPISTITKENTYSGEALVVYNKLNIDYQIITSINDYSDYGSSNMESKIISKENEYLYIKYTNKYKVNISLDGKYKFNETLYPNYIKLNEDSKVSFISSANDLVKLSDNISTSGALNVSTYENEIKYQNDKIQLDTTTNTILGGLTYYDKFKCTPKEEIHVINCFDSIENTLETLLKYGSGTKYAAVTLGYVERWGEDDDRILAVSVDITPASSYCFDPPQHTGQLNRSKQFPIHENDENYKNDGRVDFYMNKDYQNVVDIFNSTLSKETVFTWLFDQHYNYNQYGDDDNQNNREVIGNTSYQEPFAMETNTYKVSRVWWRTSDNSWALMSNTNSPNSALVTKEPNTTDSNKIIEDVAKHLLKNHVKQPFSYAFYKNTRLSDWYGPDVRSESQYIYNNPYNITLSFKWKANNSSTDSVFDRLDENNQLLNFYYNDSEISQNYSITVNNQNEAFQDSVNKLIMSGGIIEGYDLGTGLNHDINGNALITNKIYAIQKYTDLETNSEKHILNPINSAPIYVDDNYSDEYRSILHKASFPTIATPSQDTTTSGDGDSFTVLTYDRQQIFKYIDY